MSFPKFKVNIDKKKEYLKVHYSAVGIDGD
jgi:hypothetical protein